MAYMYLYPAKNERLFEMLMKTDRTIFCCCQQYFSAFLRPIQAQQYCSILLRIKYLFNNRLDSGLPCVFSESVIVLLTRFLPTYVTSLNIYSIQCPLKTNNVHDSWLSKDRRGWVHFRLYFQLPQLLPVIHTHPVTRRMNRTKYDDIPTFVDSRRSKYPTNRRGPYTFSSFPIQRVYYARIRLFSKPSDKYNLSPRRQRRCSPNRGWNRSFPN